MDVIVQIIAQAKDMASKLVNPTVEGIYKAAVLFWNQHHITGKGKQQVQANKISAVKPKGKEPTFQSQQQQPLTSLHRQVMLMLLERGSKPVVARRRQSHKTMPILPPLPTFLSPYLLSKPPPLPSSICTLLYINSCHFTKGTKDHLLILTFSRCFLLPKGSRFIPSMRQFGHLMQ